MTDALLCNAGVHASRSRHHAYKLGCGQRVKYIYPTRRSAMNLHDQPNDTHFAVQGVAYGQMLIVRYQLCSRL